ncbi:UNVERIFIED_CONTAM: hypothetical protein GTU68_037501 [Idotea baltica]|nr:hypothetical protein [Idotea baltica]
MVYIPEGEYLMGAKSDQASEDEFPRHRVYVEAFYMDEHEVTNAQFKLFTDATNYKTSTPKPADSLLQPGALVFKPTSTPVDLRQYMLWWEWKVGANWKHPQGPESTITEIMNHPVVQIAYEDALAYCKWANKRLPTEAEWEWAATGGDDKHKYPWGNNPIEQSTEKANFWQGLFPSVNTTQDGYFGTAPVKTYTPNAFGLYEMGGNVWELCADKYSSNTYAEDKAKGIVRNPTGPISSFNQNDLYSNLTYVIKGGSFLCNDDYCSGYRVSRRMSVDPYSGAMHTGFRCVKD